MKKIVLVALVCIGVLIAMEREPEKGKGYLGSFEQLPKELRQEITQTALQASTTVAEVIKSIQNASAIYSGIKLDTAAAIDVFKKTLPNDLDQAIQAVKNLQGNDLKDFTSLVHVLADKFNMTTEKVAEKFGISLARAYINEGQWLSRAMGKWIWEEVSKKENEITDLIQEGSDVNFTGTLNVGCWVQFTESPLGVAILFSNLVGVETLLTCGAIVTDHTVSLATKMMMFTAVNIPLNERLLLVKNDKDLMPTTKSFIHQLLQRTQAINRDEKEMSTNAIKIYNLLVETMNK